MSTGLDGFGTTSNYFEQRGARTIRHWLSYRIRVLQVRLGASFCMLLIPFPIATLMIQSHWILEDPREGDTSGGRIATGYTPCAPGRRLPAQFKGDKNIGSQPPAQTDHSKDEIYEMVLQACWLYQQCSNLKVTELCCLCSVYSSIVISSSLFD